MRATRRLLYLAMMLGPTGAHAAIAPLVGRGQEPAAPQADLTAERTAVIRAIVERDANFYRELTRALPDVPAASDGERTWKQFRSRGKRAQIMRLAKASFTFAGGADYIAWKINRHAGTDIQLKPWQRRWPLLAAISLLPRLLRTGAVR